MTMLVLTIMLCSIFIKNSGVAATEFFLVETEERGGGNFSQDELLWQGDTSNTIWTNIMHYFSDKLLRPFQ